MAIPSKRLAAFADCEGVVAEFHMARLRDIAHYSK
jgi:hypothetical protein